MNLFSEENYKAALSFFVAERRKLKKGVSRKLAEYLNVHPSMISQVLTGEKDFSEEQMLLVTEFLGLTQLESQYLLILLQQERAGSKKLKDYFQTLKEDVRKRALKISERVHKNKVLDNAEKAIFYSSWIYPAVHLLTTLDQKPNFEDICQRFDLPPAKARAILDFLIQLNIVAEKDGAFVSGPVATHLEKASPFLPKHHASWRLKAIQYADQISDQELMYTAAISVSRKDFARIREELMKTVQSFVTIVKDSPAEDLALINLDFLWIKK